MATTYEQAIEKAAAALNKAESLAAGDVNRWRTAADGWLLLAAELRQREQEQQED